MEMNSITFMTMMETNSEIANFRESRAEWDLPTKLVGLRAMTWSLLTIGIRWLEELMATLETLMDSASEVTSKLIYH